MRFLSRKMQIMVFITTIFVLILAGCQKTPTVTPPPDEGLTPTIETPCPLNTEADEATTPAERTQAPTESSAAEPEKTEAAAAATADSTPTLTFTDWRDAPIMPEISPRVVEIFQQGQTLGRHPAHFSVIGDCQSIPYVFMGPFGRGELAPDESESQLWNAIDYFEESIQRWAVTARGGFTAASILNPLQADQHDCKPGETPLTCEYRLNNPAYALITLETWLDPDTIDRYETYLRMILDAVIEQGTIPILLTKADSSELQDGTHIINPVIVRVGYEYQVPVVNFWRAAQYLDNFGIDPDREGFHLSQAGYNLKNILALRALYLTWQTVEGDEVVSTPTPETAPPTPTPTPEPTEDLNVTFASPQCPENCVFFGTAQSEDGDIETQGVFIYNAKTGDIEQLLGAGFNLQDVSEDGKRLLVNKANHLYEINLTAGTSDHITDTFIFDGQQGAYWDEKDETILYLDQNDPLTTDSGEGFNLIPQPDPEKIYFESGACDGKDNCQIAGIFVQAEDGITPLTGYAQPVFSPDGERLAFLNPVAATEENYHHISYLLLEETQKGKSSRRVLYLPGEEGFMVYPDVENYAFSPEGNRLIILYDVYSEYYEKSLRLQTYLWNLDNGILYDVGKLDGISAGLKPRVVWSPDGEKILFFLTDLVNETTYTIHVYQTDLNTGEKLALQTEDVISSSQYLTITNLYWR
jgi:hypothetical protein